MAYYFSRPHTTGLDPREQGFSRSPTIFIPSSVHYSLFIHPLQKSVKISDSKTLNDRGTDD
jgi:hypothetical protein